MSAWGHEPVGITRPTTGPQVVDIAIGRPVGDLLRSAKDQSPAGRPDFISKLESSSGILESKASGRSSAPLRMIGSAWMRAFSPVVTRDAGLPARSVHRQERRGQVRPVEEDGDGPVFIRNRVRPESPLGVGPRHDRPDERRDAPADPGGDRLAGRVERVPDRPHAARDGHLQVGPRPVGDREQDGPGLPPRGGQGRLVVTVLRQASDLDPPAAPAVGTSPLSSPSRATASCRPVSAATSSGRSRPCGLRRTVAGGGSAAPTTVGNGESAGPRSSRPASTGDAPGPTAIAYRPSASATASRRSNPPSEWRPPSPALRPPACRRRRSFGPGASPHPGQPRLRRGLQPSPRTGPPGATALPPPY